jgi:hypothetical protein
MPEQNPVPESTWMMVNLENFRHAIYGGWPIPHELEVLEHTFDMVTCTYGIDWGPGHTLEAVGEYLLRPDGLIFIDFPSAAQDLPKSNRWEKIDEDGFIWRKKRPEEIKSIRVTR